MSNNKEAISPKNLFPRFIILFLLFQACSLISTPEVEPPLERVETPMKISSSGSLGDSVLVMIYNDDRLRYLDSFCRLSAKTSLVRTASTPGSKIVVVMSGYIADSLDYRDCLTFDALRKKTVDLRYEDPYRPVQLGIYSGKLDGYNYVEVEMETIMSRIVVHSIKVDFAGKPYEGKTLKNIRMYLVDANARASLLGTSNPVDIVNAGGLKDADLDGFLDPDILFCYPRVKVDTSATVIDARLYAYPDAGLHSSQTKLVIEGTLDGKTYYYPFSVNRGIYSGGSERAGIERGKSYVYDITLNSLGSESPDHEIGPADVSVELVKEDWRHENEKQAYFKNYR